MNWELFKNNFHPSYWTKMQKWVESEDCDKLYTFLKERSRLGNQIAPISELTYRAFFEVPLNEINVIVCGMCPYHSFTKNNIPVADGLALSCSITEKLQPSLEIWYNSLEKELYNGLNLNYIKNPDLSFYSSQGIFMMNAALTVERGKPLSHNSAWEPFMKYFFEEVVGYSGIPVLFLGKESAKLERYITPFTHVFKLSHPASIAYSGVGEWETNGVFKKINQIIWENNRYKIEWLQKIED